MLRRSADTLRIVEKLAQQAYEKHEKGAHEQLKDYLDAQELESPLVGSHTPWKEASTGTQRLWRTIVIDLIVEYENNGTDAAS